MKIHPEDVELINIMAWFKYTYPEFSNDIHHFANERKCSFQEGRLLKRKGVIAGVSDIFLALSANDYNGLWIEHKTKDGSLSKAQKEFIELKNKRGYLALVTYGENEAMNHLTNYMAQYLGENISS